MIIKHESYDWLSLSDVLAFVRAVVDDGSVGAVTVAISDETFWLDGGEEEFYPTLNCDVDTIAEGYKKAFYPDFTEIYVSGANTFKTVVKDILTRVYSRYGERYLVGIPTEEGKYPNKLKEALLEGAMKLYNRLDSAYALYGKTIEFYQSSIDDLLGKVKSVSTSISRFNDTPQNGGDYSDDEHTTNITQGQSEVSDDAGTLMERLDEIRRLWRNVMEEAVDYVGGITIGGCNL